MENLFEQYEFVSCLIGQSDCLVLVKIRLLNKYCFALATKKLRHFHQLQLLDANNHFPSNSTNFNKIRIINTPKIDYVVDLAIQISCGIIIKKSKPQNRCWGCVIKSLYGSKQIINFGKINSKMELIQSEQFLYVPAHLTSNETRRKRLIRYQFVCQITKRNFSVLLDITRLHMVKTFTILDDFIADSKWVNSIFHPSLRYCDNINLLNFKTFSLIKDFIKDFRLVPSQFCTFTYYLGKTNRELYVFSKSNFVHKYTLNSSFDSCDFCVYDDLLIYGWNSDVVNIFNMKEEFTFTLDNSRIVRGRKVNFRDFLFLFDELCLVFYSVSNKVRVIMLNDKFTASTPNLLSFKCPAHSKFHSYYDHRCGRCICWIETKEGPFMVADFHLESLLDKVHE